jgi:hypothetical protein
VLRERLFDFALVWALKRIGSKHKNITAGSTRHLKKCIGHLD